VANSTQPVVSFCVFRDFRGQTEVLRIIAIAGGEDVFDANAAKQSAKDRIIVDPLKNAPCLIDRKSTISGIL
jgi:hypothetical protein